MWFLLLLFTAHSEQVIAKGENRLILGDKQNPCEGYMKVYYDEKWGEVGCKGWRDENDQVVCRATNCGTRVTSSEETAFGTLDQILLNELECKGDEKNLWDCNYPGTNTYQKGTRRKIKCSDRIKISLKEFECAGTVEYSRDNGTSTPGYLCKDGFGQKEADKLCESLGCGKFKEWMNDWTHLEKSGSEMVKINCPTDIDVKNLWQCAPKAARCGEAASVICEGHRALQLRGDASNVCAGKLESEDQNKWMSVQVKLSPDPCRQMHCGTADRHSNSTLNCSDTVKVVLMDNNKPSKCYGEVHIEKNGKRQAVCASKWTKKEAEVVCKELNCGTVISEDRRPINQEGIMDNVVCSGKESSLWHCRAKHNNKRCVNTAYVICTESAEVRLMDGPGNCTGRVEIMFEGQWQRVSKEGWTTANSDTVCSQLGDCGDRSKPNDPELYSQGSKNQKFLERTLACPQNAKHISECIKGIKRSDPPSVKTVAAGITCEGHKVIVLKGEKSCSGLVGIAYGDKTHWLSGSSSWNKATADAVCRHKRCGEADTNGFIPNANMTKEFWQKSYNCSANATSLFDCQEAPLQPHHNKTIATVTCKGTIKVSLEKKCWGTVKACVNGNCGGICADTWTTEKSDLLCKSEGCGSTSLTSLSASHESNVIFKSLHGMKQNNNLNQCDFIEYGENEAGTCDNNAAYVICSGSVKPRFEPSRDKCSGNVQVQYEGQWLPVCTGALNNSQTQRTICEELQCGQADKKIEYFGPKLDGPFISQIDCTDKDKKSLTACTIKTTTTDCTPGSLQCSNWTKIELTKGNGSCIGAVHLISRAKDDKRAVSLRGWTKTEGQRLCKDLKCGNYTTMTSSFSEAEQTTSFNCRNRSSPNPENIWECDTDVGTEKERKTTLHVECGEDVRFSLSKRKQCHGQVMIDNVMVCASQWKHEYSTKLCNELNCGSAIPGSFSGEDAPSNKKIYHVRCEEHHHALGQCGRYEAECKGKVVSIYCARSVTFNTTRHCGGQIKINYGDNKGEKVCPLPDTFPLKLKEQLCENMGCPGLNNSVKNDKDNKPENLLTQLSCTEKFNDIRYCVEYKSCGNAKPAEIYCNGYVEPVGPTEPTQSSLVPVLVGVGILLVLVILIVLFIRICIIRKGKRPFKTPSRMLSRQEEEFGSGEFEDIKENEMQDLNRGRFRSDAEVVMKNDALSTSSFPYDDINEAQPLSLHAATPASENNYINEGELDGSTDGVTYEVEDPQENYDDIEAGPEITQTEAEVHHSPQTAAESDAAQPHGLVMGEDDYLVPGQDG